MKHFGIALLVLIAGVMSARAEASLQVDQQIISAAELLQMISNQAEIDFDGVVIQGDVDFTTLPTENERVISIDSPIRIINSTFTGTITATRGRRANAVITQFNDEVNLSGTTFQADVVFARAVFTGLNLDRSHFLKSAWFQNTVVADASFLQVLFGSYYDLFAGLGICAFEPLASVDFTDAEFKNSVNFGSSKFCQTSSFVRAEFLEDALFIDTLFSPYNLAVFTFAEFSGSAVFQGSRFLGRTTFASARFKARTNFDRTLFLQETRFLSSIFDGKASFRNARFHDVRFMEASFETVDMNRMEVHGHLDLTDTDYANLKTYTFEFDALEVRQPSADGGDPSLLNEAIADTLTKLEENFRSEGKLELANEAFYRRKKLEWSQKDVVSQSLERLFLDIPFGYFVRPWNVILTSLVIIFVFSLFYYKGKIRKAPVAPPKPREVKLSLRLSELPLAREGEFPNLSTQSIPPLLIRIWISNTPPKYRRRLKIPRRRYIRALRFSFTVFSKFGFGNLVGANCTYLVIVEWVLGLLILAGFLYSLSNTSPILQALFGSLF